MKALNIAQQTIEAPWDIVVEDFSGGTATLLDDSRVSKKYARESVNQLQVQDGVFETRWGTAYYGTEKTAEASWLGVAEYEKTDGTRELIAIGATTGKVYKSTDGGSWTEISGATFSTAYKPCFLKINSLLYITNGFDPLTRYNGTTLVRYTELSAPVGFGAVRGAGLSAGSFNHYYQVTALNDVGETIASAEVNITTNKDRNIWVSTSNEYIDLSWTAVSGATRYQIYYSTESNKEFLLDESLTNSYRDDASAIVNPNHSAPDENTTGAPKFTFMGLSGNRIWGVVPDKWQVWWSGVGEYLGIFSAAYGGGYVALELGGRERPTWVGNYRSGKGDEATTVLCETPEGTGGAWQIGLYEQIVGDVTFLAPIATKIIGTVGTKSPFAVTQAFDSILFPNSRGIFALGNKPQITNVLATDELSQNIRPSYRSLKADKIENMCGYWYDSKVFFSATESGNENDIIFVFDTERRNWSWKWTIGVRQFLEYTDNGGVTRFLGVPHSGTKLWEFSENTFGDLGVPFYQSVITGLLPVLKDTTAFANVDEAFVELGRPQGSMLFEVLGIEQKKGFTTVATREITDTAATGEFWTGDLGEITLMDEEDAPTTYEQANVKKQKRVGRKLNAIQFKLSSSAANTKWTLFRFRARGSVEPTATVSPWRK